MKLTLTDRLLMVLAAIVIALLAFWVLQTMEPGAVPEAEALKAESIPLPSADVVVLAVVPEPTATPESTTEPESTPEPDKPLYDPVIPLSEDLQFILRAVCEETGVELALALGAIEVESDFRPDAVNRGSGCYGLMQLNPRYFPADLPPGENIRVGVEYLGQLLARYDTVAAALTAYNAGHDTGKRGYAHAVLAAAERWRGIV